MRSKTLLALLLLQWLLATCVSPTAAQLDPDETEVEGAGGGAVDEDAPKAAKVGEFLMDDQLVIVNKKIIRVNFVPGLRLNLNCSVGSGGTFYAWKKEFFVIDNNPVMFRTLNKAEDLGRYICVALPKMPDGKYKAMEFLVTEMPKDFVKKTARSGEDIRLVCTKQSSTGTYKWYRFNPKKYTFEVVSGETGQVYSMPYSSMSENNVDVGFTFYKCEPDSSTSQRDFFKLVKLPRQDTATGKPKTYYTEKLRTIDTDTGSIPTVVEPNSQVTFECYKVESGTSPAKWFFRGENTSSDLNYNEISTGYDIKTGADKSELVIRDCSVRNKGYYKCKVGGAIRYAFLDIEVIVPSIQEYSKGEYNMDRVSGVDNQLGCEIPIGGNPADVFWRITPTTGSPYTFDSNGEKPPFKSSDKTKGANQLVTLTFIDYKALKGYKVECCLGDESDFVYLTATPTKKPGVVVLNRENEGYTVASCKQDTKLAQVKFHQNDKINETIGPSMNPQLMSPTEQYYFVSEKNLWIRCSGLNSSSIRIFSDPVPLYENPPSVTIEVTGQVIQPNGRSARIAGKPVDIVCRFNNTNSTFASVDTVKLRVEGTIVAYKPVKVGEGVFKFRLTKTTPENSGKHQCLNDIQARTPRHYRIVSDVITLNWCLPNQFVCDGKCMSSSIKCNGTKECKDGTDELQSMCVPCEPNEVPCVTWKGKEPERQCVLKHWLCDATDDCGNNYDEESPLSKKWCTPTCVNNPSLSCPSNSTCCSNENKCIPRAYECDREQDCADGSDEGAARCCNLVISQPTDSQIRNATKGSRVTLTCKAVGFERPTISWRCNWGHLRSPERMTESNRVESRGSDGQYVVIGTLEISNFTEADNCIYNCEAVTKCKSELSPEITLQVGKAPKCNETCGIGGTCVGEACICKKNVKGENCDSCKLGFHSLRKDHPDGCLPCFCEGNRCTNAGLYYQTIPLVTSSTNVSLTGWNLFGRYKSDRKIRVGSGREIVVDQPDESRDIDDDEAYILLSGFREMRLKSYGGKLRFSFSGGSSGAPKMSNFPVAGIKGWRGQTLIWSGNSSNPVELTLDEQNLRAIDGSTVTRQDVMTALSSLWAVFIRVGRTKKVTVQGVTIDEATSSSGSDLAPVERCTACPPGYQGQFCQSCSASGVYHKAIDYDSMTRRMKCIECRKGYKNSSSCDICESGYGPQLLNRPETERQTCVAYAVPAVLPEVTDVLSGRTVVLTCHLSHQMPGYNGTAWLLEWQDVTGARVPNSGRVFQVRNETTTRLVIKDAMVSDSGRYRCEAFNRRSGTAVSFTRLTVRLGPIKRVIFREVTAANGSKVLECAVMLKEPSRMSFLRVTLTQRPDGSETERIRKQVKRPNFNQKVQIPLTSEKDSGFWTCHVSDLVRPATISRTISVSFQPDPTVYWDVQPERKLKEPRIGDSLRLKCNRIAFDNASISVPIGWSFRPSLPNQLTNQNIKVYSIMSDSAYDSLPSGISRDGDDLVLNPVSSEHWGTFFCDARSAGTNKLSGADSDPKIYGVEVKPKMPSHAKLVKAGSDLQLDCKVSSMNNDGKNCTKFLWIRVPKTDRQKLDPQAMSPRRIGDTETLVLKNVSNSSIGMYYCRCEFFSRMDTPPRFASSYVEYEVVLDGRRPKPKYKLKNKNFVHNVEYWAFCEDTVGNPKSKVTWHFNNTELSKMKNTKVISDNGNAVNISFKFDIDVYDGFFSCIAMNKFGKVELVLAVVLNSTEYRPISLEFILKSDFDLQKLNRSDENGGTTYALLSDDYLDNMTIFCSMKGSPVGTDFKLMHDDPTPSGDSLNAYHPCYGTPARYPSKRLAYCVPNVYQTYARYIWRCQANQVHPVTGNVTQFTKYLKFIASPQKAKFLFKYANKWYDSKLPSFFLVVGAPRAEILVQPVHKKTNANFSFCLNYMVKGPDGSLVTEMRQSKTRKNVFVIEKAQYKLNEKVFTITGVPCNKSVESMYGIVQNTIRFYVIQPPPPKPEVAIRIVDNRNPKISVRAPEVYFVRLYEMFYLSCHLLNYNSTRDTLESRHKSYIDWRWCKRLPCDFTSYESLRAATSDVYYQERVGEKTRMELDPYEVEETGFFICYGYRTFQNKTGYYEDIISMKKLKVLAISPPHPKSLRNFEIREKEGKGVEIECHSFAYPLPKLELFRYDYDNSSKQIDLPVLRKEMEGPYCHPKETYFCGWKVIYVIPLEYIDRDNGRGNYTCVATNEEGRQVYTTGKYSGW